MRAITTKYVGPTNTRGSRIVASSERSRVSIPYGHERNSEAEHRAAALALCNKLKWGGCERLTGGGTKDGYAFVFVPSSCQCPEGSLGRASRSRRRKRRR